MKTGISVILISFNQEKYILSALDGIRNQTLKPDEVIIADDASVDSTQKVIKTYVEQHKLTSKWTLLLASKNRGINGNLQNAINHSKGDVILTMSGDDICLPNICQLTHKLFQDNPAVNLITTSGYIIDNSGKIIGEREEIDRLITNVKYAIKLGYPGISPVGQAIRKKLFDFFGFLPTDVPNEDDQISFRGLLYGGVLATSVRAYQYRVHDKSASSWLRDKKYSDEEFYLTFLKDLKIRQKHFDHWVKYIQMTDRVDKLNLINLLNKKIELYQVFDSIDKIHFFKRLILLIKFLNVLCKREAFYITFGKFGILLWRKFRNFSYKFKSSLLQPSKKSRNSVDER